jgi:hypothetical protein
MSERRMMGGGAAVTMAVRAVAGRSCAVPMNRPRRCASWIVPVVALLLAAMPTWLDVELSLPRPLARELHFLVVTEARKPLAPAAESPSSGVVQVFAPEYVEPDRAQVTRTVTQGRTAPSLAVVGVGLQGLVMRSEPGGGERIRLVEEGTDLRDLDEEREAGGRYWKRVLHPDGLEGWVASDFLVAWDGVDRGMRTMKLLARSAGVELTAARDRSWAMAPPEVRSITPDQLKDSQSLSTWESFAACGPAATVAFARAIGHDLTLDQATVAARTVGWSAAFGMPGPRAELALLASVGIVAHQRGESEDTIDWKRVVGDVQAGVPVMVVTPRHYYVAEGYDAETGKLDFGNSALVLAGARKQRWFSPDEIPWLGYGAPFTTIHLGPGPQPSEYLRATSGAH